MKKTETQKRQTDKNKDSTMEDSLGEQGIHDHDFQSQISVRNLNNFNKSLR